MPRDHRHHHDALRGEDAAHRTAAPPNPGTDIAGDTAVQRPARHRQRARTAGANHPLPALHGGHLDGGFPWAPRPGDNHWQGHAELGLPAPVMAAGPSLLAQAILVGILRHIGWVLLVPGLIVAGTVILAWALLRKLASVGLLLIIDRPVGGGFHDELL